MSGHEVEVVRGPSERGLEAGFFRAECSCGWVGNNVMHRASAQIEADIHVAGATPTEEPQP